MVVARLDGSSMFDGLVPGTISPVTGIVSLMTVAYYLNKLTNADKDDNKQPGEYIMKKKFYFFTQKTIHKINSAT